MKGKKASGVGKEWTAAVSDDRESLYILPLSEDIFIIKSQLFPVLFHIHLIKISRSLNNYVWHLAGGFPEPGPISLSQPEAG